jgi:hypothetical protein
LQRLHKCALGVFVQLRAEFPRRDEVRGNIPALSTSLKTMPTSAGIFPVAQAMAIATKFEPLPEPSTPNRNLLPTTP